MSRFDSSIPATYFDDLYAKDEDPWRFATSDYERDKYRATLAALSKPHYKSALEVGCSIGVLTRQLAIRCDAIVAVDAAQVALDAARIRCEAMPQITFLRALVPEEWPQGRFDLILLSEVVYYLDLVGVDRLAARVLQSALPGADILLVHWLGETNYPLSGDAAAERFILATAGSVRVADQARHDLYRLDLLTVV